MKAKPLLAPVLVAAGALLLASCASGKATSERTTTTAPPTSTTTTSPPTSVPPSPGTSSSAPTLATCASSSLRLAQDQAQSTPGAGESYIAYTLTNAGSTPCSLEGFPTVAFYASGTGGTQGERLPLATRQSGPAPAPVTLDASEAAAFYLVIGNVPVGGVGCTRVGWVSVTPPGSATALSTASPLAPCGGTVGVTALVLASSLST